MSKQLAKIRSTRLEINDHGILTFAIDVDYENGFSQCVGGMALDTYDKIKERRVGTASGCEIIRRLIDEFKVGGLEYLKNKHCWIYGDGDELNFKPKGIQTLSVDAKTKGIFFEDIYKEFRVEE